MEKRREIVQPYAYSFPCFDFVDSNGNNRKVTACIVAISFFQDEQGRDRITYACKNAKGCYCKYCNYAFQKE
ncbi:MAG: hypothetical protein QXP52_00195 [Candidatus Aenigmatarchaeota archaeon]